MKYPGFWAVADAQRRLGWRYWGMSSWFDSTIELQGKPWRFVHLIDVGNDQKRAKAVVNLASLHRPKKKGALRRETKLQGEGDSKDVVAALIRRLRQAPGKDWRLDHLDVRGKSKRIRLCGVSWVLHVALYWFRREGISLFAYVTGGPFAAARAKSIDQRSVAAGFRREFQDRGLRMDFPLEYREGWFSCAGSRRRIPPGRALQAVQALRDWK